MRRTLTGLIVAAVSTTGLVTAGHASAAPDDQARAKASVRLTFAPKMVKKINRADIKPSAIKPAKQAVVDGKATVTFPVAKRTKRIVKLRGGIKFEKGRKHAKITRLKGNFKTGRVTALVNGAKRKPIFNVRPSSRPALGKYRLIITRYAAGSMNATFNTRQFDTGDTFGYAKIRR